MKSIPINPICYKPVVHKYATSFNLNNNTFRSQNYYLGKRIRSFFKTNLEIFTKYHYLTPHGDVEALCNFLR